MKDKRNSDDFFDVGKNITDKLSKLKRVEILNKELVIKTPESLGEYSIAFQVSSNGTLPSKLKLLIENIQNLRLYSLSNYSVQNQAVHYIKGGFEISLNLIEPPADSFLLTFGFPITNSKLIERMVRKDVQRDNPRKLDDELDAYWMHAQLRNPAFLRDIYKRLDLRDVDFGVNVAIHQDIKTAIPGDFVRNLKVIAKWIKTQDRVEKWRLGMHHLHLGRKSYTGKEDELISDIQKLFFPHEFERFVDVTDQFRYHESVRGVDFYDLPFHAFPKSMTVISRTNLNLKTPAAKGKLIYKKQVLRDEISEILGILKRAKRRKRFTVKTTPPSKMPSTEYDLEGIVTKIEQKLRATIHKKPEREKDVQDELENLFIALDYDFEREKVSFSYSTKSYRPDFTSDSFRAAIDVKLCKVKEDESKIIDQINADIPAYSSHYANLLFIVYDLGCIRKVSQFVKGIETKHSGVIVKVIKH